MLTGPKGMIVGSILMAVGGIMSLFAEKKPSDEMVKLDEISKKLDEIERKIDNLQFSAD